MNTTCLRGAVLAAAGLLAASTPAQQPTPPAKPDEIEAAYTLSIENRTDAIIQVLALNDPVKSSRVHDTLTNQYRALRARDRAIEAKLNENTKDPAGAKTERAALQQSMSKTLHEQFLTKLSADLTPEQVELIKDKMTYGKVKFTYDAYCQIVPNLTDEEKGKIMEMLKIARDEAIDGGSADEKTAIFQKYKEQINQYLNSRGHDVAKATQEWNARQEASAQKKDASTPAAK